MHSHFIIIIIRVRSIIIQWYLKITGFIKEWLYFSFIFITLTDLFFLNIVILKCLRLIFIALILFIMEYYLFVVNLTQVSNLFLNLLNLVLILKFFLLIFFFLIYLIINRIHVFHLTLFIFTVLTLLIPKCCFKVIIPFNRMISYIHFKFLVFFTLVIFQFFKLFIIID